MAINYIIRITDVTKKNEYDGRLNVLMPSVEIPGSHYVWEWMEQMRYKVSGPEGSCGEVHEIHASHFEEDGTIDEKVLRSQQRECKAKHQDLMTHFAEIKDAFALSDDESAKHRADKMLDAAHLVVQQQSVALELGLPLIYSIAWA